MTLALPFNQDPKVKHYKPYDFQVGKEIIEILINSDECCDPLPVKHIKEI